MNLLFDERYVQFDYVARTDGNPVYAGYSAQGVGDDDERWTLKKFTYDANNQCTKIQIAYKKAWSARTTAGFWA
jgi:hypothetical protein